MRVEASSANPGWRWTPCAHRIRPAVPLAGCVLAESSPDAWAVRLLPAQVPEQLHALNRPGIRGGCLVCKPLQLSACRGFSFLAPQFGNVPVLDRRMNRERRCARLRQGRTLPSGMGLAPGMSERVSKPHEGHPVAVQHTDRHVLHRVAPQRRVALAVRAQGARCIREHGVGAR